MIALSSLFSIADFSIQQLPPEQLNSSNLKQLLEQFAQHQKQAFLNKGDIAALINQRSYYIDALLKRLWHHFGLSEQTDIALIAVGGYGRKELHPLSDIDILVLSTQELAQPQQQQISHFITQLWDLRLEVGHAVRTIEQCLEIGRSDLTVATNLQESRLLCGNKALYHRLKLQIYAESFWSSEHFYQAKLQEQQERHARYHDTTYNLEPDIKSSPGGLRDIHTLSWIARRHFGATSLFEMSRFGFLTDAEYRELVEHQQFLWTIRFALHIELKRYDNRLTFMHQAQVAQHLGFTGQGNEAVEKMMKAFYRTLGRVAELNKMLLMLFDQAIINPAELDQLQVLDDDFQFHGQFIEARKPVLFQARPESILDMFIHIANHPNIKGIGAPTLRQLCTARRRINKFLHTIPAARHKFMTLVRHPNALEKTFSLMHKLGVFSAYLPQWHQIVGQMQFDLFHVYTVDEHSIRLLKHIHSFNDANNANNHPICCEIYPNIQRKDLLILAAIFHDIGKGRAGDHSELGAIDAYNFCIEHQLPQADAELVAWLVQNHLLMSVTAQKRDIYDPDVILEFAQKVQHQSSLELLLCLSVADICATNPDLWNSWKRSLLAELFHATQRVLAQGIEKPIDSRDKIRHNQKLALTELVKEGYDSDEIEQLWHRFKADYFLRHTHKQMAWHSKHLLLKEQQHSEQPLILISTKSSRGGTELFIYTKDQPFLFATVVAELDRRNFSVQDAQIMSSKDGYVLDTFMVLDQNNKPIEKSHHAQLIQRLTTVLSHPQPLNIKVRRMPRNLQHFTVETQINFLTTKSKKWTSMEFVALDTPGLLAHIGATFAQLGINIHTAKITTIGERAEDLFILTNQFGQRLSKEEQMELQEQLIRNIEKMRV